ncbi:glycosyl hydrolase family 71-domain-containing protein [Penicillium argentinense]|uniref:Glycosyl hydrolase family 71-domain-containing protein n=1 Tax=Penicillium argentinense TaxID=1131581 RepID=A0A9W9KL20_9EURO|nr:glycosyl hydrolase family 71-domain-containing protein [Penicillium argentinense]KAJ5110684.1 glycosyl hydrolase family 71-domain-containing protein [Penicillium argentinense]
MDVPIQLNSLAPDASCTDRLVFCHFMGLPTYTIQIGIVSNRQNPTDYDGDMQQAREYGIDAFALNIGTDSYTDSQLSFAYDSAARNDMKVFISFDFNWWRPDQGSDVGVKVRQFADHPAQLMVDGKVFVSSFCGDGVDPDAIRNSAGREIFFAPNFHPGQGDFGNIDGALNWMAWDSNGQNKAPTEGNAVSVADGDDAYVQRLGDKAYIAPVSPWFFTHFGDEVSYSKNWVFPSDLLWYRRWKHILDLMPRFVEIISWNDYGESHYISPLSSPHTDDGSSKWVMDMPHKGWLEMAKPFIAAYKSGSPSPTSFIHEEMIVYWYRPAPKCVNCDATDNTMQETTPTGGYYCRGKPDGWDTMEDEVFVVTLLKEPALVKVLSGPNTRTLQAPAGAHEWSVPMGVGTQSFEVRRGETLVEALSGVSARDIVDRCPLGIYNFNAYVGTLPVHSEHDQLGREGMALLLQGLRSPLPPCEEVSEHHVPPRTHSRISSPPPESPSCCTII